MNLKIGKVYFVRKNPRAYIRLLGYKILEEKENPQGTKDFICMNNEAQGRINYSLQGLDNILGSNSNSANKVNYDLKKYKT